MKQSIDSVQVSADQKSTIRQSTTEGAKLDGDRPDSSTAVLQLEVKPSVSEVS